SVASVEIDFKPDKLRQRISLGKDFLCGWYSVKIAQSEEKVNFAEASFAVMPHTVKADFKTPFGVDFFSSYQGFSATRRQAYIKALKQMGVSSVRERVYWPAVEPQRGEWDFYGPDRVFEPLKQDGFEIMSVYSGTPDWASNVKGVGDGPVNNLFDVYNSSKKLAQYYDGKVNAWEILNEPDTNAQVPLDIYAAFMKTAAVGIVDSGAKAKKIGASWALYPELGGNFAGISLEGIYANGIDLALQNDVAKYSDAYNIHTYYEVDDTISDDYTILLNRKVIDGRLDVKRAYDTSNKMVYMTETGASFPADANIKKAQHADARAIVTGTVNQLANDVDRIWWFSMVSQIENGREFGMFSPYHMPYPKYVAAAVLVKTLKKAECIGMLNHLPHGACGAVFNTGTGNTAVLWSEKTQNVSLHCDNAVVLTDIMGHTTKLDSVNGTVSFSVGKDPVYVDLQGAMCYCNYKALDYAENDESSQTLDKTQRVVLLQRYGVGNEKDTWAKATKAGYQFENGLPQAVYLDIYNFNHETISGTLKTKVTGGFTVSGLPQSFTVAPMSKVTLPMTVSVDGAVQGDMNSVTVLASCGVGGETKSVARVIKASSDGSYKSLLQQKIKLNGISENAVLKSSSATCMAQLSTGVEPGSTKVYLMGREVPYELEGRTVKIQLDGLENGCYKLLVTAHTDDGYAVRASVQFYIEE
ncbi:MAG: hypothetical protein RR957_04280, partial [Oscillospiraceae bacterium]